MEPSGATLQSGAPQTDLDYTALFQGLQDIFHSGKTRPFEWRAQQLMGLKALVLDKEKELLAALAADLGKPAFEAFSAELAFIKSESDHCRKHLKSWMKPRRVSTPLVLQPATSRVVPEPLGVVLVMGAWNYPIQLTLGPLINAIGAGNCAILKPSDLAENTSRVLAELLPKYVDPSAVKVIEGGIPESTGLLKLPFDHIFYTGNGAIARIVMEAAAKHLTPLTLELGGKSPCIVDKSVDLKTAAKRIIWGKFYNAGQTCIAPDYILAHKDIEGQLVEALKATLKDFFGEDPHKSPDFARIINQRHHARISKLIASGEVVAGGQTSSEDKYIAPTILRNVKPDSPVMQEEIFGPLLPIMTVDSIDEAIRFVIKRDKPLALYVFSSDKAVQQQVMERTTSGGAVINHCMMHVANPNLPFGGVGPSGMGSYHGKSGFDHLSHLKPILNKPTFLDPPLAYPPYNEKNFKLIRKLM